MLYLYRNKIIVQQPWVKEVKNSQYVCQLSVIGHEMH